MSVVYRAVQQSLGREVALKVLSAELQGHEIYVERFRDEARTLAKLEHPHILPVYDLGTLESNLYIATPLVRGGSVRDQLLGPPLPTELAWKYLTQVADALHHAHEVDIIHRDLKPSNILVHSDGRSVLADFGVARLSGRHVTFSGAGTPVGTPGYMAPEQAVGDEIDRRADIYALAVVAFELLTGARPFPGLDSKRLVHATLYEAPPSARARNPQLPAAVDAVLARGLGKRRAQRPDTTLQFIEELGVALAPHRPSPPSGWPSHQRVAVGAGNGSGPSAAVATPPGRIRRAVPAIAVEQMGVERRRGTRGLLMNSYFGTSFHAAMHVAGDAWIAVIRASGLELYEWDDPPDDAGRGTPVQYLSRLCDGFDAVFGGDAPDKLRQWGRLATEVELEQERTAGAERRSMRVMPGQQRRLVALLRFFTRRMDEVRGEELHFWQQSGPETFNVVLFSNSHAVTREKPEKACDYWVAALEANLRWAGLANDWVVSEVECGATTGSFDCVFAIKSAAALVG